MKPTETKAAVQAGEGKEPSLLLILLLPILGAIFGSNAFQLGSYFACPFWLHDRAACNQLYMAQDGMLTLAVGFLVLIAAGVVVAYRRGSSAETVFVAALVTIVSGLFSALKTTDKVPFEEGAAQFLFFLSIIAILFAFPVFVRPHQGSRWEDLGPFYASLAIAALVGGLVTGLLQYLPKVLPAGWFPPSGTKAFRWDNPHFWVSAPLATGLLMPPWILATFDPILRSEAWRHTAVWPRWCWTAGFIVVAIGLVLVYPFVFYGHPVWLNASGINTTGLAALFACLLLPPLAAAALMLMAANVPKHPRVALRVAASVVALAGAALVAFVLVNRAGLPVEDAILFAFAQGLSSIAATLAAFVSVRTVNALASPKATAKALTGQ